MFAYIDLNVSWTITFSHKNNKF